jgi:predicted secreted protein
LKIAGRTAVLAIAIAALGVASPAAGAATVSGSANGKAASLLAGESLTIDLKPANSGSSGFHWAVATKPSKKVLRLTSDRPSSDGKQQVFTYRALGPGTTPLVLRYRAPGRHGKTVKTFRLGVAVNEQEPQLDCSASGRHADLTPVANSGTAVVFTLRRTLFAWLGGPFRIPYDAYYGCELSQQQAFRLGGVVDLVDRHDFWNIVLDGSVVGYVHEVGCSFVPGAHDCIGTERTVESQDLHTGKLIRRVAVTRTVDGSPGPVSGLVVSPTGGLGWIEQGRDPEGHAENLVRRSDAPADPGAPFATSAELLDRSALVDPDSLRYDGADVIWTDDGKAQRAPLR